MRDAEGVQVIDDPGRMVEGEPGIELQPIGCKRECGGGHRGPYCPPNAMPAVSGPEWNVL
jgi:hypothetical protein